jgi:hypothetical protein
MRRWRALSQVSWVAVLLALTSIYGARAWRQQLSDLLRTARQVPGVKPGDWTQWLENGSLLALRYQETGGYLALRIDPNTGRYVAQTTRVSGYIWSWRHDYGPVSPDGHFWLGYVPEMPEQRIAGDIQAGGIVWQQRLFADATSRRGYPQRPVWLRDSRRWVEAIQYDLDLELLILDVRDEQRRQRLRLPELGRHATKALALVGATRDDRLVFATYKHNGRRDVLIEVDLRTGGVTARQPPRSTWAPFGLLLSPTDDHLAWHVMVPRPHWTHTLSRLLGLRERMQQTLCVMRRDGTAARPVGYWRHGLMPSHWSPHVQWLPDGQHVSLWHQDTQRVIPVPREGR